MLSLQPFFIQGITKKNVSKCRKSSLGAVILFVVTFSLALAYAIFSSIRKRSMPDETLKLQEAKATSLPGGMTDYTPTIPMASFHAMGSPNDGVLM
jgi:hypothetical protein